MTQAGDMSAVGARAARFDRSAPMLVGGLTRSMRLARHAYAGGVLIAPPIGTVWALQGVWESGVTAIDLALLVVMYTVTQLGVTLGYHRYLSHRALTLHPALELTLLVFAAMAGQGPPLHWVADHRRHHEFADEPGDLHSPHVSQQQRKQFWSGFWHAHVGWTFSHALTNTLYYCRDLQRNARVRFVQQHYFVWLIAGLALPAAVGFAVSGDAAGALSGLLWGGFVRLTLSYHATMSINSLTHLVGTRAFATRDRSHNLGWLALATFGEGWHNNHHAFPSSAFFALRKSEIDLGAWFLRIFAALGLASNLKRPSERAIATRRDGLAPPHEHGLDV